MNTNGVNQHEEHDHIRTVRKYIKEGGKDREQEGVHHHSISSQTNYQLLVCD